MSETVDATSEGHEEARREPQSLDGFVFVGQEHYDELAAMALEEPWSFYGGGTDVLRYYLNGTFLRLVEEGKLGFATDAEGDMCVWCTGLVNAHYEDIYCLCVPNDQSDATQNWMVQGFCVWGPTRLGQRLRRAFGSELPPRARYFDAITDGIYDGSLDLVVNFDHIRQRINRIGTPALRVLLASSRQAMDVIDKAEGAPVSVRDGMLQELNAIVANDAILQQTLHGALTLAAERARARARYMYASALPSWNPKDERGLAFCLPLCLVVEERVDAVLIARLVKDSKEPFYDGRTICDPQMAYLAARVVQRVDGMSGWVMAAFTGDENVPVQATSAFAVPKNATPSLPPTPRFGSTPVSIDVVPLAPRAKLVPVTDAYRSLLVCDGDTIGLVRRTDDDPPRIQLPAEKEFYNVSHRQGRFTQAGGSWVFTHEGANWTRVTKGDGSVIFLDERGSSVPLEFGDALSFVDSPEYRFMR